MKQSLLIAMLFCSILGACQTKESTSFPVLANAGLSLSGGQPANVDAIDKSEPLQFTVWVFNPNATAPVKAGSCYLQIDLGKKLKPVNTKNVSWPLPDYFTWKAELTTEGFTILKGELKADLPADFMQRASLDVACLETGSSIIKAQWIMPAERIKSGSLNMLEFTIQKSKK